MQTSEKLQRSYRMTEMPNILMFLILSRSSWLSRMQKLHRMQRMRGFQKFHGMQERKECKKKC